MKTNAKIVIGTVGLGLLAALASFALQPPSDWDGTLFDFRYPLTADILMTILHIGAAFLFFMSLSVYKAKLRLAFLGIVLGILLTGLGTIQLPVLDVINGWESFYVTSGIIALPFLISGLAYYFGSSSFSRLVGEKNIVTNRLAVILAAIVVSVLSTTLPHSVHAASASETDFDITNALFVWVFILDFAAALIFLRLRKSIGAHYKSAVIWLSLALLSSVTCVAIAIADAYTATSVRTNLTLALNTMVVVAGFVWLKAGYTFTKTKDY